MVESTVKVVPDTSVTSIVPVAVEAYTTAPAASVPPIVRLLAIVTFPSSTNTVLRLAGRPITE